MNIPAPKIRALQMGLVTQNSDLKERGCKHLYYISVIVKILSLKKAT
jgi:hypothetical protein